MAMFPLTPQAINCLNVQLGTANPVTLLVTAEAGGVAAMQNIGSPVTPFYGACSAVASFLGFPLSNYSSDDADTICAIIGQFMRGLSYLTGGPSLTVPAGNFYGFYL
jgi:hypothetical protein